MTSKSWPIEIQHFWTKTHFLVTALSSRTAQGTEEASERVSPGGRCPGSKLLLWSWGSVKIKWWWWSCWLALCSQVFYHVKRNTERCTYRTTQSDLFPAWNLWGQASRPFCIHCVFFVPFIFRWVPQIQIFQDSVLMPFHGEGSPTPPCSILVALLPSLVWGWRSCLLPSLLCHPSF